MKIRFSKVAFLIDWFRSIEILVPGLKTEANKLPSMDSIPFFVFLRSSKQSIAVILNYTEFSRHSELIQREKE